MSATKKGKKTRKPLIILTAGGTGGHVYPAEALADELLRRGYRVELITDSRGKDNYKGRLGEIPNHAVLAGALVGKSRLFKIKSLIKTAVGVLQAGRLIFKKKPTKNNTHFFLSDLKRTKKQLFQISPKQLL